MVRQSLKIHWLNYSLQFSLLNSSLSLPELVLVFSGCDFTTAKEQDFNWILMQGYVSLGERAWSIS